jgi:hypothetical protein
MANYAILDLGLMHSLRLGQPSQEEHSHELENQTEQHRASQGDRVVSNSAGGEIEESNRGRQGSE